MPDNKTREEIFKLHVGKDHNLSDENFKLLAKMTEGFKYPLIFINPKNRYSGSDISMVVNDAFMRPIKLLQLSSYYQIIKKYSEI